MSERSPIGVVVVAAGRGTRLGAGRPKAFVELAGEPLLARALRALDSVDGVVHVVVVAPADELDAAAVISRSATRLPIDVVEGADSRQGSVAAGLAALDPSAGIVLVHDAARCLAPSELFERVAAEVAATGAGIVPGRPLADTVKRVDASARVLETPDRSSLRAVQTPQGFPRSALVEAFAAAEQEFTDDAALAAAHGLEVRVIDGDARAEKITTPADLDRAAAMLGAPERRTGIGIDVHAYDAGSPLWLGGLHWPDEPGLSGHSDGDAVAHAVCDALLSAAGLGDIGGTFGTDDPRFANAHGDVFIAATLDLVRGAGFRVVNVAVQVVGARPKLAPRRVEVERRMTQLVGAPVSVGATTTDGLGFTGRGEGLTAIANALLESAR